MNNDPTQEFLQTLPEIKPDETFWFSCHPQVPCFNACCADLTMPLTPYDVLRLRKGLSMSSDAFFEEFAIIGCYPDTGFPLLHLRMEDSPSRPCPFVTEAGCGIYEHRSSACRTYPLGRATRPVEEDAQTPPADSSAVALEERYFLVREDHCKGFAEKSQWTKDTWLHDQRLEIYNSMNDRYMRLIARYKAVADKAILSSKHATMGLLALYQQDMFLEFIRAMNVFTKIRFVGDWAREDPEQLQKSILTQEEQRLLFGFEWMELILFGIAPRIAPQE